MLFIVFVCCSASKQLFTFQKFWHFLKILQMWVKARKMSWVIEKNSLTFEKIFQHQVKTLSPLYYDFVRFLCLLPIFSSLCSTFHPSFPLSNMTSVQVPSIIYHPTICHHPVSIKLERLQPIRTQYSQLMIDQSESCWTSLLLCCKTELFQETY